MPRREISGRTEAGRRLLSAILTALTALALFALPAPAGAAPGQLDSWGSYGFGNKQFSDPTMLGVDPGDGAIFAGDLTQDRKNFRIQKFSAAGTFEGSVLI